MAGILKGLLASGITADGIADTVEKTLTGLSTGVQGAINTWSAKNATMYQKIDGATKFYEQIALLEAEIKNNKNLKPADIEGRRNAITGMQETIKILGTDGVLWNVPGEPEGKHPELRKWERDHHIWLGKTFIVDPRRDGWSQAKIDADRAERGKEAAIRTVNETAETDVLGKERAAIDLENTNKQIRAENARLQASGPSATVAGTLSNAGHSIGEKFVAASESVGLGGPARGLVDFFKGAGDLAGGVFSGFSPGGKGIFWGSVAAIAAAVVGPRVLGMLPVVGGWAKNGLVAGVLALAGLWFGFGGGQQAYLKNNPVDSSSPYSASARADIMPRNPLAAFTPTAEPS